MLLLSNHDPSWVEAFAREAEQIRKSFGELALRIKHVGSTSIPHFDAKPIIDIQISVANVQPMDGFEEILAELGYRHLSPPDPGVDVFPFCHKPNSWRLTTCTYARSEENRSASTSRFEVGCGHSPHP